MNGTAIKNIRRHVKKERQKIAFDVVKEIYAQSLKDRLMIAFNIIFKRG